MEIKEVLTLFASLGALIFSLLNFRRNKRLDNENHLYKTKMEIYSKLLGELSEFINCYEDSILKAQEYLDNRAVVTAEELDRAADDIDEAAIDFINFIVKNSLVIPVGVTNHLEDFANYLTRIDMPDEDKISKATIKDLDKEITVIIEKANRINDLLRDDLQIEQLNSLLHRRLK